MCWWSSAAWRDRKPEWDVWTKLRELAELDILSVEIYEPQNFRQNPDEGEAALQQFRRRTLKVAVHETGHMFGMQHCTAYECLMNGSNNLTEMDQRPMWFCPECVQKVWWACAIEPVKYYQSLVEFADEHQLAEDRQFWNDSLERVKP